MTDRSHGISLKLPANPEDLLIARMTLGGLGMLAGLDADTVGDLRTVTNECCDCLMHQNVLPSSILMEGWVMEGRLFFSFMAQGNGGQNLETGLDMDIVRGILETLIPVVKVHSDQRGVYSIECSIPV
ncbi:MAG: hypothetical protein PHI98_07615 [Eubacteriales bacterium]|nr:hypothetical protein [Eubacteriales bacterium]